MPERYDSTGPDESRMYGREKHRRFRPAANSSCTLTDSTMNEKRAETAGHAQKYITLTLNSGNGNRKYHKRLHSSGVSDIITYSDYIDRLAALFHIFQTGGAPMRMFITVIFMLGACIMPSSNVHAESPLRAGAAKIKTSPAEPIPLAGFYVRQGPFTGVHDDLYARAVVFESGGTEAALITVDICVLTESFWNDVTDRIARAYPIAKDHIILNASHTHGGPALYEPPDPNALDASWLGKNPYEEQQKRYTEELKNNIVKVVGEARKRYAPAVIGYGRGSSSIGINRRALDPQGKIWLGVNPDGPTDRDVGVVRIDTKSGKTIAVMYNFGCHGTSMMSEQLTGDWCGICSQYIERKWGGDIVAPFLSGAAGDVNPIYEEKKEFDARTGGADVLAMMVGEEVMRVANGITAEVSGPVQASQKITKVPGKRYLGLLGFDPKYDELAKDTSPVPDTPLRMSAIRVGEVLFAGSSAEVFCEIGKDFKQKSPYQWVMFMGLCNGYASYVLSDKELGRGGYEYNASVVKEGGQKAIVSTLIDIAVGF
ncbi:neutral/alkaline non-lysosomal ceramidase N-terminal domain-containing protein [bacterium]|nr:neutral/alkaline non-lysosomal ceramidase N-terminal domain-containing protein [bacterium]